MLITHFRLILGLEYTLIGRVAHAALGNKNNLRARPVRKHTGLRTHFVQQKNLREETPQVRPVKQRAFHFLLLAAHAEQQ